MVDPTTPITRLKACVALGERTGGKFFTAVCESAEVSELVQMLVAALPDLTFALTRLEACERALTKHLIVRHLRMTHGGGDAHSGWSCRECNAETEGREVSSLVHEPTCFLARAALGSKP